MSSPGNSLTLLRLGASPPCSHRPACSLLEGDMGKEPAAAPFRQLSFARKGAWERAAFYLPVAVPTLGVLGR